MIYSSTIRASLRPHCWLTATLLLVATAVAPASVEPPVILILAGQSNMLGQGERTDLPAGRRDLPPNVELIEEGLNGARPTPKTFGPELALAHELAQAFPAQKFRLLKFAVGTTSIRAWAPDWTEAEARVADNVAFGALYPRWMDFLRRHRREGDPAPHAILWFQGERDARFPATAEDYGPRLAAFIARLRRDLAAEDGWFVHGVVNPPYAHTAQVVTAQRATTARVPRVRLVESEGLSKRGDGIHYDTAGQWELGRRFARELLPTLKTATKDR